MNRFSHPPLNLQTSSSTRVGHPHYLTASASYYSKREAEGQNYQLVGHWPLQHAETPNHLATIRLVMVIAMVELAEEAGYLLAVRRKFPRRTAAALS